MNKNSRGGFVICIDNKGYAASLDVGKVYRTLPTEKISRDHGMIRVIDNEGEDYLYSTKHFVEVRLPRAAQQAVLRAR